MDEQTVAEEPDDQVQPDSEGNGAQELDALLSEWDQPNQVEPQEETTPQEISLNKDELSQKLSKLDSLEKMMKEETERRAKAAAAEEMEKTVTSLRGDSELPEAFVRAFLFSKADQDPRLSNAYMNKEQNPTAWAKIEKSLRNELFDMVQSLPNKEMTQTREKVASAVQNSKQSTPEVPENLRSLSDNEFEKIKAKAFKASRV